MDEFYKKIKKFTANIGTIVLYVTIDIIMLYLYIVCLNILNASEGTMETVFNVISNILLVGISILTTTIITVPLIKVREDNALCNKILSEDVLSSSEIFNNLPESKKLELLKAVECNLYFDNDKVKESMYCSIRDKINYKSPDKGKNKSQKKELNYYFDLCDYDIECKLIDGYIEKRITKTIEIRSYENIRIPNYALITSCFSPDEGTPYCEIESLHINNSEYEVSKCIKPEFSNIVEPLDVRSGYKKQVKYVYNGSLHFSQNKSSKIQICYITRVDEKDIISSFRLGYPCRKYRFKLKLLGDLADKYNISMNAFGFCDDGKNTPNNHNESEVRVSFEDWIFPSDGVAVVLKSK